MGARVEVSCYYAKYSVMSEADPEVVSPGWVLAGMIEPSFDSKIHFHGIFWIHMIIFGYRI